MHSLATQNTMPPLPTLIIPCVLGTFMFTLALIDLAVDLTGDGALIVAWYGASPLPIVKHFLMYVLPLLLLGLLAKTALKSVPGVLKGTAGCGYACGPVLLIPVVIALTVAAKAALDPELATFSSRDPIDAGVLAWVTQLHALKCLVSPAIMACGITEYIVATAAVSAAERKEAATKEADKQRLADLKRQYMEAKGLSTMPSTPRGSEAEPKKDK